MHSEATTFRFSSSNNLKYQNGQYSYLKQRKFVNELVRPKKGSSKLHNLAHYPVSFVKIFKANFLDSYGILDLWITYFWWKMIFIHIKSWILKQRELVNELYKAWKGLYRDTQLGSLTDFCCQTIRGQFSGLFHYWS